MNTVFDIWMIQDRCTWRKPHYPIYKIDDWKMGSATTLEKAEALMKEMIEKEPVSGIHSFHIKEVPLDRPCIGRNCLASYLYDNKGHHIDERTFSTIMEDEGVYPGRKPEQMRFNIGDIVEVNWGDEMHLGVVVGLPVSYERARLINSDPHGLHLDDSDDSYIVIYDNCGGHDHVDTLALFKPMYKMHPAVEKRFRDIYNNYETMPARLEIANTTAHTQLSEIFEDFSVEGTIEVPQYYGDCFSLNLNLPSGIKTILVDCDKVYHHIDRVRITLSRIIGIPVKGIGYKTRKDDYGQTVF